MFKSSHDKGVNKNELTVSPKAHQSYQPKRDPLGPSVSICLLIAEPYGINLNIYSHFHHPIVKKIKCVS